MTDDTKSVDPLPEDIDPLLHLFVTMINALDLELGVTVTVDGALISGIAISGDKYFAQLRKQLAGPSRGLFDPMFDEIEKGRAEVKAEKAEGSPDRFDYITLREARPFTGDTNFNGGLWRVRLSAVGSWSIGQYQRT